MHHVAQAAAADAARGAVGDDDALAALFPDFADAFVEPGQLGATGQILIVPGGGDDEVHVEGVRAEVDAALPQAVSAADGPVVVEELDHDLRVGGRENIKKKAYSFYLFTKYIIKIKTLKSHVIV